MTRVRPELAAALALALCVVPACREAADTVAAADEQMVELVPDHQRMLPQGNSDEARWQRAKAYAAAHAEAPGEVTFRSFEEGTPEAKLLDAILRRLKCHDGACAKAELQRLRDAGPRLLEHLPAVLEAQPEPVLLEAMRLAGLFEVKAALEPIGRLAVGASPTIEAEAVWALGAIGTAAAAGPLTRLARAGLRLESHQPVCRALGRTGDPEAADGLAIVLATAAGDARLECIDALGAIPTADAVQRLEKLAKGEPDARARAAAATALGKSRGPGAAKALARVKRSGAGR